MRDETGKAYLNSIPCQLSLSLPLFLVSYSSFSSVSSPICRPLTNGITRTVPAPLSFTFLQTKPLSGSFCSHFVWHIQLGSSPPPLFWSNWERERSGWRELARWARRAREVQKSFFLSFAFLGFFSPSLILVLVLVRVWGSPLAMAAPERGHQSCTHFGHGSSQPDQSGLLLCSPL